MSGNVFVYGKAFTTSYIFIHVLRRILGWAGEHLRGHHFHLVLDDRRDATYARSLLPGDRVTVHAQYATLDPFREDLGWPPKTVERWERFYGSPNFRIYMDNERILEGRREEEKWRYLLSHLEQFERFCLETRPVLYVSGAASSIHPWIGILPPGQPDVPIHTREFRDAAATDHAHARMRAAACALALTALDVLSDRDVLKSARAEFERAGESG